MCWVIGERGLERGQTTVSVCARSRAYCAKLPVASGINVASNFPLPRLYSFTHSFHNNTDHPHLRRVGSGNLSGFRVRSYIARDTQNDTANKFVFLKKIT